MNEKERGKKRKPKTKEGFHFEVDSGGFPNPDFTDVSDVCFRRVFQTPVSDMFQTSVSDPGFRPWFQTPWAVPN